LTPVFSGFEVLPECSFEYRECGFGDVSPGVFFFVKGSGEFSSILSLDLSLLSFSDGNQRVCIEILTDQTAYPLGVVSLIHDIPGSFSGSVRLVEQMSCQSSTVRRVLGDRRCQDHLRFGIYGQRYLQESLAGFPSFL